jgi:hypothetical protein
LPHRFTEFILSLVGKLPALCFIELDFTDRSPRMKHSGGRDVRVGSAQLFRAEPCEATIFSLVCDFAYVIGNARAQDAEISP